MARPPLPLGTHGDVRTYTRGKRTLARTLYRDYDGEVRQLEAWGTSKSDAKHNLGEKIRDRRRAVGGDEDLTPEDTIGTVADRWYAIEIAGVKALTTCDRYFRIIENYLKPAIGRIRIRELTTGVAERWLKTMEAKHGASMAKMCRTVLASIAGYCARHDCLAHNPVREVATIAVKSKKKKALTVDQVHELRIKLRQNKKAVDRDLPEFCDIMLATGVRISEASAFRAVDLHFWRNPDCDENEARLIDISGNIVRVKGRGLIRQEEEDENGKLKIHTLKFSSWAERMLQNRIERLIKEGHFDEKGPLFPAPKGGWRDPSNTQADLREAFDAVGFPKDMVTSHTFRHTVATTGDRAGLPTSAVQSQLAHSRQATTHLYIDNVYADNGMADALERFDVVTDAFG